MPDRGSTAWMMMKGLKAWHSLSDGNYDSTSNRKSTNQIAVFHPSLRLRPTDKKSAPTLTESPYYRIISGFFNRFFRYSTYCVLPKN